MWHKVRQTLEENFVDYKPLGVEKKEVAMNALLIMKLYTRKR